MNKVNINSNLNKNTSLDGTQQAFLNFDAYQKDKTNEPYTSPNFGELSSKKVNVDAQQVRKQLKPRRAQTQNKFISSNVPISPMEVISEG